MPYDYLDHYEAWMRAVGRSPRTITQRTRMALKVLHKWPDPREATPNEVSDWLGQANDLSKWTRATYYSDMRAFFKWLAEAGHIAEDPTDSKLLERPTARAGVPKPLSAAEEARALAAAHGHMKAWLMLALCAGLRAAEIAAFRGEEIAEDHIVIVGKGSKEAAIPTHALLWQLAQEYPRRGWWFPSPSHDGHISGNTITIMVGRHFRRPEVDIPKGSIHRCRHSYATSLLRRGANMKLVQDLMRHSSPATTAIYTAVNEDELRAAINTLGPVA